MDKFLAFLKFLVKLPVFWMPSSWKGYRRTIINGISVFVTSLMLIDIDTVAAAACNIWALFSQNPCPLTGLSASIVLWLTAINEVLKNEGEVTILGRN